MPSPCVPNSLPRWMAPFAGLFTRPTWEHVLVLVAGAILTPGRRTVTAALSVLGQRDHPGFTTFHRVLNRNRWSVERDNEREVPASLKVKCGADRRAGEARP